MVTLPTGHISESTLIQCHGTDSTVSLLICMKGHYIANAMLGLSKRERNCAVSMYDFGTEFSALGAIQLP